jgi:hypothetical protein
MLFEGWELIKNEDYVRDSLCVVAYVLKLYANSHLYVDFDICFQQAPYLRAHNASYRVRLCRKQADGPGRGRGAVCKKSDKRWGSSLATEMGNRA